MLWREKKVLIKKKKDNSDKNSNIENKALKINRDKDNKISNEKEKDNKSDKNSNIENKDIKIKSDKDNKYDMDSKKVRINKFNDIFNAYVSTSTKNIELRREKINDLKVKFCP